MDIIKEYTNSTKKKFCIFSGNNAALIKKQFENNLDEWEEVSCDDEKHAIQVSNFIWR